MGGFEHLDGAKPATMKLDPESAERIHGKESPMVHIETYGCRMNTKNTTSNQTLPDVNDMVIGTTGGFFEFGVEPRRTHGA
ncbi:MAG TPA: hypothetical protein VD969_17605 [Symbiobacteriaceae bacterium]|nr:hypothetical protein [Symbiobacteriaceae bacterium]